MTKAAAAEKAPKTKAKAKGKAKGKAKAAKPSHERASEPAIERVEPPARQARAASMQLAAEVARLEFELAVARAQMVDLVARAETDALTDLINRRGFERELRRSLAYVKRYGTVAALIYIDLDDFKHINDRYGHAAGDAVLKAVAMVLSRHVRASDMVARIGGDEFAMLLWNCSEADALAKAAALEAVIGRTTATHAGVPLSVGGSCGIALLLPLEQPAELLERADRAMYARKAERGSMRAAAGA